MVCFAFHDPFLSNLLFINDSTIKTKKKRIPVRMCSVLHIGEFAFTVLVRLNVVELSVIYYQGQVRDWVSEGQGVQKAFGAGISTVLEEKAYTLRLIEIYALC